MHLLFHQLKKDLFKTRWLLAGWLAFVAIQFVLLGFNANPSDRALQAVFAQLAYLLPMLNSFLILVLIPSIVLQEPAVGTTAFWLTRPLRRSTVLGAKALFALILVLVPLVVQTIILAANGIHPGDVALAAAGTALQQFSWIAVVAALAALCPSYGRFAIAGAILFVAALFEGQVIQWLRLLGGKTPYLFFADMTNPFLTHSQTVAGYGTMILCGAAVFIHQYATRKTVRSIVLAALGGLAILAVQQFWPWDFLKRPDSVAAEAGFDSAPLGVTLSSGSVNEIPDYRGGLPQKMLQAQFTIDGASPEYTFAIKKIEGKVTFPEGGSIDLPTPFTGITYGGQLETDAIERALGDIPTLNAEYAFQLHLLFAQLFMLDGETYAKHAAQPGTYEGTVTVAVSRYKIAAEVPLVKGTAFQETGPGSRRITITDILQNPDGIDVRLRERQARLLLDPRTDPLPGMTVGQQQVIYVLLNRKRSEAVLQANLNGGGIFQNAVGGSLLSTQEESLSFGPGSNQPRRALPVPLTPEWLADATLVRLEQVNVATFTKPLDLPKFRLDGATLPQGASPIKAFGPNLETLNKITLPDHPTRAETWRYISEIMHVSQSQGQRGENDPQTGMLMKVGDENIELLFIALARYPNDYYLKQAINKLATADDKELVLRNLDNDRELIDTVTRLGWQAEAEPILVHAIESPQNSYVPAHWLAAIASLKDPSTYDALGAYVVNNPNGRTWINEITNLPGPVVSKIAGDVWKEARGTNREAELMPVAAKWGVADALDRASEILATPGNAPGDLTKKTQARTTLKIYSTATGATDAELVSWYAANRGQLVFDPYTRRFAPPAPPTADGFAPAPISPTEAWPDPLDRFKDLGRRAATGDLTAIDAIEAERARLYAGVDPQTDREKMVANGLLLQAAFDILGQAAATQPDALKALQSANGKTDLSLLACRAYGTAAAGGNADALAALLDYKANSWPLGSATLALRTVAEQNNPQAVDFMIAVLADPTALKGVVNVATNALQAAANQGNAKAKAALDARAQPPATTAPAPIPPAGEPAPETQ